MPRAAPKSRQPAAKPYSQPTLSLSSTTATSQSSGRLKKPQAQADDEISSSSKPASKAKGGEYNKQLLVSLVIKSSSPNWEKLAAAIGKTPVRECRDTWRKTICPSLLDGRDWSLSGPEWDSRMKIAAVLEVLSSSKPDWAVLGNVMEGKTATLKDVWRKVVFPRLKKGLPVQ